VVQKRGCGPKKKRGGVIGSADGGSRALGKGLSSRNGRAEKRGTSATPDEKGQALSDGVFTGRSSKDPLAKGKEICWAQASSGACGLVVGSLVSNLGPARRRRKKKHTQKKKHLPSYLKKRWGERSFPQVGL